MKKLLIFGNSEFTEHIYYNFKKHSDYNIVAFIVDDKYKTDNTFCGLPLESFEGIEKKYSPDDFYMFIAVGYSNMNKLREFKALQAKEKGFNLISFIHPSAIIAENVKLGDNCFIFENTVIQPYCELKNNVFIYASSTICHHSIIHENVFIGSNVCVNGYVNIKKNSFIGAGSIIRNGIIIEEKSLIGAGCTILKDTKQSEVYKAPSPKLLGIPSTNINI